MAFELITAPAVEPVSLDEAKAHLRIDHNEEDGLIARLIKAARQTAERQTGRALITQSWRLWCDAWPRGRSLELPKPPLTAVSAVSIYSRSGTATALSSDAYVVDRVSVPGRLVLREGTVIPADLQEANGISIDFDAGYGENASDVPAAIRSAILGCVAFHYEARGQAVAQPPAVVLALLAPYRVASL